MADEHITSEATQTTPPAEPAQGDGSATAAPEPAAQITPDKKWRATPDGAPETAQATAAPPSPTATPSKPANPPAENKDLFREVAETVVFVVVLVLLLKTFIAEAFVIPTGSMATTLWGYQKYVTCPNCAYEFPVNCSGEIEAQPDRSKSPVTSCDCPNCRFSIDFTLEHTGRLVRLLTNQLVPDQAGKVDITGIFLDPPYANAAFSSAPVPSFELDPAVKVTIDGQPGSREALTPDMQVRAVFRTRDAKVVALEAARAGGPVTGQLPPAYNPTWYSGDRVLVFKALYDSPWTAPQRHDVVVFKFPVEPQVNHSAMNYIKRLIGLPGETIAISHGQLYVYRAARELPRPEAFWSQSKHGQYPWPEDPEARELFKQGKFEIVRKAPNQLLALRRIVHDNDYQPANTDAFPPRWQPETTGAWKGDGLPAKAFSLAEPPAALSWLRYRHVLAKGSKPALITDFLGYNSGENAGRGNGQHWVGDLLLEADVQTDRVEAGAEVRLELAKGAERFQARFDLANGDCTLVRIGQDGESVLALKDQDGAESPATRPTPLKGAGKWRVRFANVDNRLTLWVDGQLPFGDGVPYTAGTPGPTAHDLQPASLAVKGASATVAHLQLWRDSFYLTDSSRSDPSLSGDALTDPARWNGKEFREQTPMFMYVHPEKKDDTGKVVQVNHYLCLGDNSSASADSRSWGLVPEPLMLGRALMVYFPFSPFGGTSRVGPIQ